MDFALTFPGQVGLHLKSLRKAAGMSQKELAALLQVSQSRVAAIEKDPAAISVGQFLAILKLLDAELVVRAKNSGQSHITLGQESVQSDGGTEPTASSPRTAQAHETDGLDQAPKSLAFKPQLLSLNWQNKKPKGSW
ncbi:MAG: helix-turn-helix transcriptional regulator [Acidovorax sp.]|jgi:HTH-type transcriptional regulator/antitoxin HipB|nr:helix-turn-helix transcriptional regulator [Acidovorax sp.]